MDTLQHRLSRAWLIIATILWGLSLLGWPIAIQITMMALGDNASFARQVSALPGGFFPLWATLAYPAVVVVGLVGGWVQHAKHHYRAAFWLSVLPLGDIALVVLGLELLQRIILGYW